MKKLMIAACAVAFAVAANAGTVSWNLNKVYNGNNTDLVAGNAYMFVTQGGYDTTTIIAAIADAYSDGGAAGLTAFLNANALGKNGTAVAVAGTGGDFSKSSGSYATTDLGLNHDTTYNMYAVIFNQSTFDDDMKYFVTSSASGKTKTADAQTNTSYFIGSQNSTSSTKLPFNSMNPDNWHSVPEPTSGLLLLLGVAGLALRRKQK